MPLTDASGHTEVLLSPGTYRLIEVSAPGGPYVTLVDISITIPDQDPFGMDFQNVPATPKGS
jgi:hypothetical protein